MQIHELNNYSGALDSNAYFAVDNGTDTGKVSAPELLLETNAAIEELDTYLNERIDNIITPGAAPSDAEVVDARLGDDGVLYATLGDSIREQAGNIKDGLINDVEQITGAIPILFHQGRYATSSDGGTATYTNANDAYCAKIAVTPGDIITICGGAISSTQRLYVFEDVNGQTFGRAPGNLNGVYSVKVPAGAVYMYINNILSEKASGWWAYKGTPIKSVYPVIDDMQNSIELLEYGGNSAGNLMSGGLISGYYQTSGNITPSNSLSHIIVNVENLSYVKIGGIVHDIPISSMDPIGIFFDLNGDKVGDKVVASTLPVVVEVPANAVTLGINSNYKAADYPSSIPDGMYCNEFVADTDKNFDFLSGTKKIKVLAGIIRNDGNGWALLDNVDHEPINMASVELTPAGQIVVNYGFTASKVLTLVACPDETFAKKYTIGGSVAQDKATFNVCNLPYDIGGLVKYDSVNQVWDITFSTFTGVSFDNTTGELTLTHESVNGLLTKEKYNFHAQGRSCNVWAGKVTDTTVKIFFLDSSGNIIKNPASDLFAYVTRHVNSRVLDASNIVDASGNFWLFGIMEIE